MIKKTKMWMSSLPEELLEYNLPGAPFINMV